MLKRWRWKKKPLHWQKYILYCMFSFWQQGHLALSCYKHNQTGLICWHSQALCRVNMNFRLPLKLLYLLPKSKQIFGICKCYFSITPERLRCGPRDLMTSNIMSDCSESHTKPMVTISGAFISTRRILITWPHLLWWKTCTCVKTKPHTCILFCTEYRFAFQKCSTLIR